MELHDKNLKDILSHSKLELPFSDFENRMLRRIEEFEKKKKEAERNKFFSHVCFMLGIVFGSILTYLMSQNLDQGEVSFLTKENYSFITQLLYVCLIVLFADKLWKISKYDFKNLFK